VSYRRHSQAGGIERTACAKNPRAASGGCYIDRRTCGSNREAGRSSSAGKDTEMLSMLSNAAAEYPYAVSLAACVASTAATASVRRQTAKI